MTFLSETELWCEKGEKKVMFMLRGSKDLIRQTRTLCDKTDPS